MDKLPVDIIRYMFISYPNICSIFPIVNKRYRDLYLNTICNINIQNMTDTDNIDTRKCIYYYIYNSNIDVHDVIFILSLYNSNIYKDMVHVCFSKLDRSDNNIETLNNSIIEMNLYSDASLINSLYENKLCANPILWKTWFENRDCELSVKCKILICMSVVSILLLLSVYTWSIVSDTS
jgi:hypothetical protein